MKICCQELNKIAQSGHTEQLCLESIYGSVKLHKICLFLLCDDPVQNFRALGFCFFL